MYGRTSSAETSSLGMAPAGNERACYSDLRVDAKGVVSPTAAAAVDKDRINACVYA